MEISVLKRILILVLVGGLSLGCDRITKDMARADLTHNDRLSYVGSLFSLQYEENRGAVFSLGADLPADVRFWIFVVLMGFLLAGILAGVVFSRGVDTVDVIAAALVAGGGFGNLLDRVLHNGWVIDFITVGIGQVRTAVFNLADVAIIAGVALFVIMRLRRRQPHEQMPDGSF